MNFFDLVNISERYMELVNPASSEKIVRLGHRLGLQPGMRVIDFGCGFAEPLVLWAEHFGIEGVGIDIRPYACERAQRKIGERGLSDQLQIVCGDAAAYQFEAGSYDVAACLGATFIWDGFAAAVSAIRPAIKPDGLLAIGEVYWLHDQIPAERRNDGFQREIDLLHICRDAGLTFTAIVRASADEWDRYQSDNWLGLIRWLRENRDHVDYDTVSRHLHNIQDDYLRYGREHHGWAMYVIAPLP